jgi:hypoxanthine-DNA glycosylase
MLVHPLPPVWDRHCRILILGSFPSVRSREEGFYYGHPQNRFWKLLAAIWDEPVPGSKEDKIAFLLSHRLALWDVIASCEITGSADSSIQSVVANDISPILSASEVRYIVTNGKTASTHYQKFCSPSTVPLQHIALPSTSPANAAWNMQRLLDSWQILRDLSEE